ncbi:MAG: cohesin domain-containing protein [Thermoanaerobaculia bacterium]
MSVGYRWLTWTGLLVVAVVFGSIGCGGGGGGGGGPTEPPPPSSGVTFTAAGSAGANSIYLAPGTNTAANRFVLDVKTSQVDDLYGVSFNLEFPDARLRWVPGGSQEGSFLSSSGSTDFIVAEDSPGVLIVGLSLLGDVAGSSGSGTLLSLEFEPVSSGSGPMTMTRHDAINSTGDVKTLVEWIGGSVSVSI